MAVQAPQRRESVVQVRRGTDEVVRSRGFEWFARPGRCGHSRTSPSAGCS
jgi:hypothetical protein